MTEKSYVTMEQKVCPVCATVFDSGSLLLDRRLLKTFEQRTVTGWQLCEPCEKLSAEYVALVEVDQQKSGFPTTLDNAYRLGRIVHVRRARAKEIQPDMKDGEVLMWADSKTIDALIARAQEAANGN